MQQLYRNFSERSKHRTIHNRNGSNRARRVDTSASAKCDGRGLVEFRPQLVGHMFGGRRRQRVGRTGASPSVHQSPRRCRRGASQVGSSYALHARYRSRNRCSRLGYSGTMRFLPILCFLFACKIIFIVPLLYVILRIDYDYRREIVFSRY